RSWSRHTTASSCMRRPPSKRRSASRLNVLRQLRMHVCRYDLRGPLATSRLTQGPEGSRVYTLKQPKADGTMQLVFSPATLLQRLAALLPQPRMRWTVPRPSGFGSAAAQPSGRGLASRPPVGGEDPSPPETAPPSVCGKKSRWADWTASLKRVSPFDSKTRSG